MSPLAVLLVALVAEDATPLRSGPDDAAAAQATLYRGDWLEVRGEAPGFLKVWDHRRERAGYVRRGSVRRHKADETSADELRFVVRFLREAAGFESLGIGYAALYLRVAATAGQPHPARAEVLGALGAMAERLARRSSGATRRNTSDATLVGQLAVAESYGVTFRRFEQGDRMIVCYDGDAFGRLLALTGAPIEERARATLSLTRRGCLDPSSNPTQQRTFNEARLALLAEASPANPAFLGLPAALASRLRLRTAEALAEKAHDQAAQRALETAATAAAEALRLLALVDQGRLPPEDRIGYDDTAVRVAAVRWLVEPPQTSPRRTNLQLEIAAGRPGESCLVLRTGAARGAPRERPLTQRCTFGVIFPSSIRFAPGDRAATVAVAPVSGWTELWVLRPTAGADEWRLDVIPPALGQPGTDIGYVETAGFSPDGQRLLVAREYRLGGVIGRRFEVLAAGGVSVERWASSPQRLGAFQRWASPVWQKTTLAAR